MTLANPNYGFDSAFAQLIDSMLFEGGQKMDTMIELERELNPEMAAAVDSIELPPQIRFNVPGNRAHRYLVATPENLIQAGRALADLDAEEITLIRTYRSPLDGRSGALVRTPGNKYGEYSTNAVLVYGEINKFKTFAVRKIGTSQDGKCFEKRNRWGGINHPGFDFRYRLNKEAGFDPRFTITKHVVAALLLCGLDIVFVDNNGHMLDAANCNQIIATGYEWERLFLQNRDVADGVSL